MEKNPSETCLKEVLWENTASGTETSLQSIPVPDVILIVCPLFLHPLTVTSHYATKRPVDANRKFPRTGTALWATAAQPPHPDGANWTAARRRCGRGSPEEEHGGWKGKRTRFNGEKNEGESWFKDTCRGKKITDGHIYNVCSLDCSCAYMNQVVIIQRRGVEGAIFIGCIV